MPLQPTPDDNYTRGHTPSPASASVVTIDMSGMAGMLHARTRSPCAVQTQQSWHAPIQLEKLGDVQIVFTEVTLADHRREDLIKFVNVIRDIDEIVECHLASGGNDYLLKFATRSVSHYQSIVEGLLERDINIEKYFSYVIVKSPFVKRHYPLETLFSQNHH